MTPHNFYKASIRDAIPSPPLPPLEFARRHVRLPVSARSERFDDAITPWTREVIERLGDLEVRRLTFIKPVQSGGSTVGEIALCWWIAAQENGDIFYNWEDDQKAEDRWFKRVDRILKSCDPVKRIIDGLEKHKYQKGLVAFPRLNLTCQGVFNAQNLDSDSVRLLINEEVHNWTPGMLDKAYRRKTAFPNYFSLQISNAGTKGDQLHGAFIEGTMQQWQVLCPGCGAYHVMRTRWDDKAPQLGGLRYDSEGCKSANGDYNYTKLAGTIRYQFPCGYTVRDNHVERRALSLSGCYSQPTNPNAPLSIRSYTLDSVAVDYIPWLDLIMEKHKALKAMRYGDPELWYKYLRERECVFSDPNDRPMTARMVLSMDKKKDREGLMPRYARFAALDRQQGTARDGELPHWWIVIRDVDDQANSLLVYEGKAETDTDAVETLSRHSVLPRHVVCDSGDDTTHVYQFCLRNGYNAIKGGRESLYAHEDGGRRIFSPERPLWQMLNLQSPTKPDAPVDEPQFWLYGKAGIRDRLAWLRASKGIKWEVPADVSEDYKEHMDSEEMQTRKNKDGYTVNTWTQIRARNDLFVCECYIAMMMEMAGLIGQGIFDNEETTTPQP